MKWKLAFFMILLALPGVAATSWLALPLLVDAATTPVPLETLQVATAVQGALFVLVAATLGTVLAPKVGMSAPAMSAVVLGGSVFDALRPQLAPGLAGGCIGAAVIITFHMFAPESLAAIQGDEPLPLAVRILYGGITEEILVRWGLMTLLAWTGWRLFQRNSVKPSCAIMWTAIVLSALLFGVSHVPSVAQSLPTVSAAIVAYITIGNALFGVVAGYLFWRYGLEAAVTAHILAHILAYILRG